MNAKAQANISYSYLPCSDDTKRVVQWTPSISQPERLLTASVEALTTFLRVNVSKDDLSLLCVSQMTKVDLLRHCLAIVLASDEAEAHALLAWARGILSPYGRLSRNDLIGIALDEGLLGDDDEFPERETLLEMLVERAPDCSVGNLFSPQLEDKRREIALQCLDALRIGLGRFLFLQEAKNFLHWAWADAPSFESEEHIRSRVKWLLGIARRVGSDAEALNNHVIFPMIRFLRRHVIPFIQHMPVLIPCALATVRNLRIGSTLRPLGVMISAEDDDKNRSSFFKSHSFEEDRLAALRIPQQEALAALKTALASRLVDVNQTKARAEAGAAQYLALSHLRIWFAGVLHKTYDGRPLTKKDEEEGRVFCEALRAHTEVRAIHPPLMIVLPTGVGKTVVMCCAPFFYKARRVLVLSPNVTIREQLTVAFETCYQLLRFDKGPVVAFEANRVTGQNRHADVFVCNNQQLHGDHLLRTFPRDFFDLVIVDEAHHAEAFTYRVLRDHFYDASFLFLTATPFRGDGKEIDAVTIYSCPTSRAMQLCYIKSLYYVPVPVVSVKLVENRSKQSRVVSGDEVAAMSDAVYWAVRNSDECKLVVMSLAMKKLREMRALSGIYHQIIAQASDQGEACDLVALWRKHPENDGLKVHFVSSSQPASLNAEILSKLSTNELDVIIHVGMLGEGFDHPQLSICCVFRRFGSFAPYAQFVGRIVRRISNASEADNCAYIIAHPALGIAAHWKLHTQEEETPPNDELLRRSRAAAWDDITDHVVSEKVNELAFYL